MNNNLKNDILTLKLLSFEIQRINNKISEIIEVEDPFEYYQLNKEDADMFVTLNLDDLELSCTRLGYLFDKLAVIINRFEYLNQ